MDIKDVVKCKRQLEERLLREIKEFEELTKVSVNAVNLKHTVNYGSHSLQQVFYVDAEIKIVA